LIDNPEFTRGLPLGSPPQNFNRQAKPTVSPTVIAIDADPVFRDMVCSSVEGIGMMGIPFETSRDFLNSELPRVRQGNAEPATKVRRGDVEIRFADTAGTPGNGMHGTWFDQQGHRA